MISKNSTIDLGFLYKAFQTAEVLFDNKSDGAAPLKDSATFQNKIITLYNHSTTTNQY